MFNVGVSSNLIYLNNFFLMDLNLLYLLLPVLFVMLLVFYLFKSYSEKQFNFVKIKSNQEISYPIILQAHERLALFLERIKLENLLTRLEYSNFTARELHGLLISEIKNEFNHNIAQQIYIKSETWSLISGSVNTLLSELNNEIQDGSMHNETAKNYALKLLKSSSMNNSNLINTALEALKIDVQSNF